MAVTFDANAVSPATVTTPGVSTLSVTTLTIGTGANRVLVAQYVGSTDVTSMAWDPTGANQALTLIFKQQFSGVASYWVELWGLVAPVSGNKTLTATLASSATFSSFNATSFNGASQAGGAGTFYNAGQASGSSTSARITVASAAGDMVIDTVAPLVSPVSAPLGTQTYNASGTSAGAASYIAASASTTLGWTVTPTAAWGEVATAIRAANHNNLPLLGVG